MSLSPETIKTENINSNVSTYKGRWGWHPLPYESYTKLKELHKWAFDAYHKHCLFYKWSKKTVNREEKAPETDPDFTIFGRDPAFEEKWGSVFIFGCMVQYQKNEKGEHEKKRLYKNSISSSSRFGIPPYIEQIIDSYNICRRPKKESSEVEETPLNITEIDNIYNKIISSSKTVLSS